MGTAAPDDGWRYHPKHIEQFADINKLYTVAPCYIIVGTDYATHGPLNIKFILQSFCTVYVNHCTTDIRYQLTN